MIVTLSFNVELVAEIENLVTLKTEVAVLLTPVINGKEYEPTLRIVSA